MLKRAVLGSLVVLLCAGACGGSSSSDDGAAGLALDDVPQAYAEAFCEIAARCNPYVKALVPTENCESYFLNVISNQGFDDTVDAVDDGRAKYDGKQMQHCVDTIKARSCDELSAPDPESCDLAAVGSVQRGDACTTDVECAGDSICQFADSCPGTCTAKLNAGDSCSGDDQCKDGLVCSDDTGRCVAPAEEGEDCEGGVAPVCTDNLFCIGANDDEGTAGTCQTLEDVFSAKLGEECDFENGPWCEEGAACVITGIDTDGLITECAKVAQDGDDCNFGVLNPCQPGSVCRGPDLSEIASGKFTGTCEPQGKAGDDCDPNTVAACAFGTLCLESGSGARCVALKDNGVSCDSDAECWSEHCVGGGCAPTSACND